MSNSTCSGLSLLRASLLLLLVAEPTFMARSEASAPLIRPYAGFSFDIPETFSEIQSPQQSIRVVLVGPPHPRFRSNITVSDEHFTGTAVAYLRRIEEGVSKETESKETSGTTKDVDRESSSARAEHLDPLELGTVTAHRLRVHHTSSGLDLTTVHVVIPRMDLPADAEVDPEQPHAGWGRSYILLTATALQDRSVPLEDALDFLLGSFHQLPRSPWPLRLDGYSWEPTGRFGIRLPDGFSQISDASDDAVFAGPWDGGFSLRLGVRFLEHEFPRSQVELKSLLVRMRIEHRLHQGLVFPLSAQFIKLGPRRMMLMTSRRPLETMDLIWLSILVPMENDTMLDVHFQVPSPAYPIYRDSLRRSLETFVMGPVSNEMRARIEQELLMKPPETEKPAPVTEKPSPAPVPEPSPDDDPQR